MKQASKVVSRTIAAAVIGTVLTTFPAHAENAQTPGAKPALQSLQPVAPLSPPDSALAADPAVPPPAAADLDRIDLKYVKGFAADTGRIVTSPLRWEASDWLKAGLVAGGTVSLFLVDKDVKDFAQKNQSGVASGFAKLGNALGEPVNVFPAVGAAYLYGHLADDAKVRRVSLLTLESLTISGVATMGIKSLAGRHRPNSGDPSTQWHGPSLSSKNVSFCSGHTSNAFAVATVVANEYGDKPYVAPAAYSLATLTALSRIYKNEHWLSDTFFGAAIGYFTSKAVLRLHPPAKGSLENRLSLVPQVGKEMTGLTVSYKF
uniref:Phosphoesterase PA-phosphatase related protein n=1 Tax=Geobacter sp. (strain M21) TaxID=443144 RepID=C6E887_GEOSM